MSVYVLCHGAWAGGWRWRERGVSPALEAAGHEVFTPTYTGLGDRAHLAHPDVDLQDIVMVLRYEDLADVILVGWSYGGMVITGVAERAADRIAQLVYVDAFVPLDGQSVADIVGPQRITSLEQAVQSYGDGWQIPPDPDSDPRHTPQPLASIITPIKIANPAAVALPRTYIYCTEDKQGNEAHRFTVEMAERTKTDPHWQYREVPTDHNLSAPQELISILLEFAQS